MSLYHEAAELLAPTSAEGGSLKSRVFKKKNLKSNPNQLYALVFETCKWSPVLKEIIEKTDLLKHERKVRFCRHGMLNFEFRIPNLKIAYTDTFTPFGSRLFTGQARNCAATEPWVESIN